MTNYFTSKKYQDEEETINNEKDMGVGHTNG